MVPFINFVAMRQVDDDLYELDIVLDGCTRTVQLTEEDLEVIYQIAEEYPI